MSATKSEPVEMTEGRIKDFREGDDPTTLEWQELLDLAEEGLMARVGEVCARVGRCVSHRANRFEHDDSCPVRQYGLNEALRRKDPELR